MSTITRTLRNLRKIGLKDYWAQLNVSIGDTKWGAYIGSDRFRNKYYENKEELPLRTKWVVYHKPDYDASEIEPGWHAWMHHLSDKPPTEEPILQPRKNPWSPTEHIPNGTLSRNAYKPYSTVKATRIEAWVPEAKPRSGSTTA
ncbi:NADH ubiquinone oxidoreductase subunit NDUFA12-domain-containing protein [Kalaharituber pfeilii]|nr:NADH ubiquinone oxidoreductase subunit NDUFA12-domain-containing protein [Kalaharituber pfeilii]